MLLTKCRLVQRQEAEEKTQRATARELTCKRGLKVLSWETREVGRSGKIRDKPDFAEERHDLISSTI